MVRIKYHKYKGVQIVTLSKKLYDLSVYRLLRLNSEMERIFFRSFKKYGIDRIEVNNF